MIGLMMAAVLAAGGAAPAPAKSEGDGLGKALRAASALNACRNHVKSKLLVPPAKSIEVKSIHGDEVKASGVWVVDFDVTLKDAAGKGARYAGRCTVKPGGATTSTFTVKPA